MFRSRDGVPIRAFDREPWLDVSSPRSRSRAHRIAVLVAAAAALGGWLAPGRANAGSMKLGPTARTAAMFERLERQNVGVYERMVQMRDANPAAFDRNHPFYGALLTSPTDFAYWLNRWQSHHQRFEHFHPLAWRVIAGEAYAGGPPTSAVTTPEVPPTTSPLIPPAGQGLDPTGPPTTPTNPNPPAGPTASGAVPEPASCVMLVSSMAVVAAAMARSRRKARPE
ncbi:hypothetical protein [Aquisphaera insulae]|uniref:hypothetical protein n=1 Tax=Aquisphaera insulae TaxID=2712864 RepID=UPI0013EDA049|nr:hypothetical protein [Aquisphaera insulae]